MQSPKNICKLTHVISLFHHVISMHTFEFLKLTIVHEVENKEEGKNMILVRNLIIININMD